MSRRISNVSPSTFVKTGLQMRTPRTEKCVRMLAMAMALAAFAGPLGAQASGPIRLPFLYVNRHLMVEARIGDSRPLWLIADTGAGITCVDMAVAKSLDLAMREGVRMGGAGNARIDGAFVSGASFTLAAANVPPQAIKASLPLPDDMSHGMGRRIDGILGNDFLSRYTLEIDYARRQMVLHPRDSFEYSGPGEALPMEMKLGHPHIKTRIETASRTLEADTVIDIGAGVTVGATRRFLERTGLDKDISPTIKKGLIRGVGGESKGRVGRIRALHIGGVAVPGPLIGLSEDEDGAMGGRASADALLGNLVLSRFRIFVDFARNRVIFEKGANFDSPEPEDWSGLAITARGADFREFHVEAVNPDLAGAQAGFRKGDVLVRIDGQGLTERDLDSVRAMFRGDRLERDVTVSREGKDVTLRLAATRKF